MGRRKKLLKVGLTGGIASGKSTVVGMFAELGAECIDADRAGHRVIEPGRPACGELKRCFGDGICRADGTIDRKLLGDIVFGNPAARRKLENIVHPRLLKTVKREIQQRRQAGARLIMVEAAVLVETDNHSCCDQVIVVYLPVEQQMERLRIRDNLCIDDILARLDAQLAWKEKLEVADHVIDNSGTQEETREQVLQVWKKLEAYQPAV